MDMYSKVVDGIVADIAHEDGYRLDEKELSLENEKPKYPPYLQESLLMGVQSRSKGARFQFDAEDAAAMNKEAIDLGVIKEPMAFPYMSKKEPNDHWNRLCTYDPTSRAGNIRHVELVCLDDSGQPVFTKPEPATPFKNAERVASIAISQWLDMNQEKDLKAHLLGGYCAYVVADGSNAYWITVPHYFLFLLWEKEQAEYKRKVYAWEALSRTIDKAKKFNLALAQQTKLAPLPFNWKTDKLSKETAVVNNIEDERYHDTHLVLVNGFTGNGYYLMTGDFLCLVDDNQPIESNNSDNAYEYVCKVEGVTLKTVPHVITCKQCQSHIETILKELISE